MRLRLVSISEETAYDSPKGLTAAIPEPMEPEPRRFVIGRLEVVERNHFGTFTVPAEMVRGAEVGDEFTVYLERVKK